VGQGRGKGIKRREKIEKEEGREDSI